MHIFVTGYELLDVLVEGRVVASDMLLYMIGGGDGVEQTLLRTYQSMVGSAVRYHDRRFDEWPLPQQIGRGGEPLSCILPAGVHHRVSLGTNRSRFLNIGYE